MSFYHIQKSQMSIRDVGKYTVEKIPRSGLYAKLRDYLRKTCPTEPFSAGMLAPHMEEPCRSVNAALNRMAGAGELVSLRAGMFRLENPERLLGRKPCRSPEAATSSAMSLI